MLFYLNSDGPINRHSIVSVFRDAYGQAKHDTYLFPF